MNTDGVFELSVTSEESGWICSNVARLEQRNEGILIQYRITWFQKPKLLIRAIGIRSCSTSNWELSLMQKTKYCNTDSTSVKPNDSWITFMRRFHTMLVLHFKGQ